MAVQEQEKVVVVVEVVVVKENGGKLGSWCTLIRRICEENKKGKRV